MINFTCPRYREPMSVPAEMSGRTERCPACGYDVEVPAPATGYTPVVGTLAGLKIPKETKNGRPKDARYAPDPQVRDNGFSIGLLVVGWLMTVGGLLCTFGASGLRSLQASSFLIGGLLLLGIWHASQVAERVRASQDRLRIAMEDWLRYPDEKQKHERETPGDDS